MGKTEMWNQQSSQIVFSTPVSLREVNPSLPVATLMTIKQLVNGTEHLGRLNFQMVTAKGISHRVQILQPSMVWLGEMNTHNGQDLTSMRCTICGLLTVFYSAKERSHKG